MKPAAYITTSWDDGHPFDYRVAALLTKYGLRGTFYVPMITEHGTTQVEQIRELSRDFEIGAHTLHHIDLTYATEQKAWQEIIDSKSWLEDAMGRPCQMFCPPSGKYSDRHLEMVRKAGFSGVRSVELLSMDFPRRKVGLMVLPTTIQAHPHGLTSYARNIFKRVALRNLWLLCRHGRSTDWVKLVQPLLFRTLKSGGVFHLWGHSWELQQTGQWQRLEEILRFIGEFTSEAPALTNGQICELALARVVPGVGIGHGRP